MTKSKLTELVLEICAKHDASAELTAELKELVSPKVGGGGTGRVATPEDYTVFDAKGNVTHVFCNAHKVWEDVSEFKEDAKSKNGFKRECTASVAEYNAWNNQTIASKKAIMNDVLDGVISGPQAKDMIEKLPKLVYAESLGSVERP